MGCKTTFW